MPTGCRGKKRNPKKHAHETQNAMRDERKTDSVLTDLPKIPSHRNKGLAAQYQRADRAGRPFCVAGANELSKQYGCRPTLTCVSRRVRKPAGPGRVKALGALWGQDASNRVVRACWAPDPPAKRCLPTPTPTHPAPRRSDGSGWASSRSNTKPP